jgi:hypothetical protein
MWDNYIIYVYIHTSILWDPPTVQWALPNRHSKQQLWCPLGSAPPSDSWWQTYKNAAPGMTLTVVTQLQQDNSNLLSQRSPTSEQPVYSSSNHRSARALLTASSAQHRNIHTLAQWAAHYGAKALTLHRVSYKIITMFCWLHNTKFIEEVWIAGISDPLNGNLIRWYVFIKLPLRWCISPVTEMKCKDILDVMQRVKNISLFAETKSSCNTDTGSCSFLYLVRSFSKYYPPVHSIASTRWFIFEAKLSSCCKMHFQAVHSWETQTLPLQFYT